MRLSVERGDTRNISSSMIDANHRREAQSYHVSEDNMRVVLPKKKQTKTDSSRACVEEVWRRKVSICFPLVLLRFSK